MTFDREKLTQHRANREAWERETLGPTLDKLPERKDRFVTQSSVPINRLYTPADVPDHDYDRDLGNPGAYPFTRGIHATGHRGRQWTMRMFAGFGVAEETNARLSTSSLKATWACRWRLTCRR